MNSGWRRSNAQHALDSTVGPTFMAIPYRIELIWKSTAHHYTSLGILKDNWLVRLNHSTSEAWLQTSHHNSNASLLQLGLNSDLSSQGNWNCNEKTVSKSKRSHCCYFHSAIGCEPSLHITTSCTRIKSSTVALQGWAGRGDRCKNCNSLEYYRIGVTLSIFISWLIELIDFTRKFGPFSSV